MTSLLLLIGFGVLGLIVGSFLNVCISRLPAGESVVSPGSRCPSCRTAIRWYDNVPLVSYLALGGRCRHCRAAISPRYPMVEAVTAVAFVLQGLTFWPEVPLLASRLAFTAILVTLFCTDLEIQRLPNVLTIPGTVAGALASVFLPPGLTDSLLGIFLGGATLLVVRWTWKRATGVDGMGLGDVKMLAMIGAFLGWRQVIVVLFLSSVAGAVIGVALTALQGRSMQSKLPFGTFLAMAAFVASLAGESLLAWYLSSFQ